MEHRNKRLIINEDYGTDSACFSAFMPPRYQLLSFWEPAQSNSSAGALYKKQNIRLSQKKHSYCQSNGHGQTTGLVSTSWNNIQVDKARKGYPAPNSSVYQDS